MNGTIKTLKSKCSTAPNFNEVHTRRHYTESLVCNYGFHHLVTSMFNPTNIL